MSERAAPRARWRIAGTLVAATLAAGCSVNAPGPETPSPTVAVSAPSVVASQSPAGTGASADRYQDGIPTSFDGRPVLRGAAATAAARSATDPTPFLVGGWVTYWPAPTSCPADAGGPSWLHDCGSAAFADQAGEFALENAAPITFRFVLATLRTGPVIAEVEVHDPRAQACGSDAAACDRFMVVQRVLWTGDALTDPHPIGVAAVEEAIAAVQPASPAHPIAPDAVLTECGDRLPAAQLLVADPYPPATPSVIVVEVEPSVAARARAKALVDGVPASLTDAAVRATWASSGPGSKSSGACRWLMVGNAAVLAQTSVSPNAADRAFLTRLWTLLVASPG